MYWRKWDRPVTVGGSEARLCVPVLMMTGQVVRLQYSLRLVPGQ